MKITEATLIALITAAERVRDADPKQTIGKKRRQARLKEAVAQAAVELGVSALRPRVRFKDMTEFERAAYEFGYERSAHPSNQAKSDDYVIFDNRGVAVEQGVLMSDLSFRAHSR